MSSVYDEPPPKKGRAEKHAGSSADRTPSKQPSRKRKRRSTAASDPDEEVEPDDKVNGYVRVNADVEGGPTITSVQRYV